MPTVRSVPGARPWPPAADARPVLAGEVFWELLPDGSERLGGAPFRVAWHLKGFGLDPVLVTRVGRDRRGDTIVEAMRAWGLDISAVQSDPANFSGLVRVRERGGRRTLDIQPERAFDRIDGQAAAKALVGVQAALLYRTSLSARAASTRTAIAWLDATISAPRVFDANLRSPWWDPYRVRELLSKARVVRLTEGELAALERPKSREPRPLADAARRLRERYGLDLLAVSLARGGGIAIGGDGKPEILEPGPTDAIADPGRYADAFSAVVVLGLFRGWTPRETIRRASAFAARAESDESASSLATEPYREAIAAWAPAAP